MTLKSRFLITTSPPAINSFITSCLPYQGCLCCSTTVLQLYLAHCFLCVFHHELYSILPMRHTHMTLKSRLFITTSPPAIHIFITSCLPYQGWLCCCTTVLRLYSFFLFCVFIIMNCTPFCPYDLHT